MCYLLNALSCTDWHIWKKLRKYIFMFTRLKVVPTIKIGTHTGPSCHVKNVTFWKFSWYCEKTRWKALYFYMINMICMMCVFIWIFTQLHFYLIDDSYVGQKYGIEFSCQFRCRNMSCETSSVKGRAYNGVSGKCSHQTLCLYKNVSFPNMHTLQTQTVTKIVALKCVKKEANKIVCLMHVIKMYLHRIALFLKW